MITLPPYISEWEAYVSLPPEDRWIFNKIQLAERLGYVTLPTGLRYHPGTYCVRPIMNLEGGARGGFRKITLDKEDFIQGSPGYCVTPWLSGWRHWHMFVDDVCWYSQRTVQIVGEIEHMEELEPCMQLPHALQGISRYMIVETLGDTIIDVGPRHMTEEAHDEVVKDYQQFDPNYEAPEWCTWHFGNTFRTYWNEDMQAYTHEEIAYD